MKCGYGFKMGYGFKASVNTLFQHIYYALMWYVNLLGLGNWTYSGNNIYLQAYLQSIPNNPSSGNKTYSALSFQMDVTNVNQIVINNTMVGSGSTDNTGINSLIITNGAISATKILDTPTTGIYTNNSDLILNVSAINGYHTFSIYINQQVRTGTLSWNTTVDTNISRIYPIYAT
jgi:hypothetical protein